MVNNEKINLFLEFCYLHFPSSQKNLIHRKTLVNSDNYNRITAKMLSDDYTSTKIIGVID